VQHVRSLTSGVTARRHDGPVEEIELPGGGINRVVLIGDAVHRPSAPWSAATRELLSLLHSEGLPVPAWRGTDEQGRDVLDYLPGEVGHYPLSEAVRGEAALVSAARLLRRFHDVSVPLVTRDLPWQHAPLPDAEVIVHGDYAPYNLVFADERVVGIIDVDYARPGPRTFDLSYAIYRFAPLASADDGWGTLPERAARVRLFCESYGLDACDVAESVAAVVPRLLGHVSYMREEAAAGSEAFARHLAEGHAELYSRDASYVTAHLADFGA
jgi:aminoglycoside phosphotransferase (APT) family kinase protein